MILGLDGKQFQDALEFNNRFTGYVYRNGTLRKTVSGKNGVTTLGKNHILNVVWGAASPVSQIDPWYVGLINNTPTPTLLAADSMSSHTGWAEYVGYTEGTRPEWDDADASASAKATSVLISFSINATVTIYGIFVTSSSTKSGTSGTLMATGNFTSPISLVNGDTFKVDYGIGLS